MYKLVITLRNTSFKIGISRSSIANNTHAKAYLKDLLKPVLYKFITYRMNYVKRLRRMLRETDKEFFCYLEETNEYIFHIRSLQYIMHSLKMTSRLTVNDFELVKELDYEINTLDLKLSKDFTPKDYQANIIKQITAKNNRLSYLLDLPPGKGKSLMATHSVCGINYATLILVLPKYILKWIEDIKKYTNATDDDIFVVRGSNSIHELLEAGNTYKFIIMSTRTMQMTISDYEKGKDYQYDVPLEYFAQHLKIGTLLNDETHQEFHLVYKAILYLNVKKVIGSSATLVSKQQEMRNMYNVVFPMSERLESGLVFVPYLNVVAVSYNISSLRGLRFNTPQGYSHVKLEECILMRSFLLREYMEMIDHYLKKGYMFRRQKGDKALIFVSRINMAKVIVGYLNRIYKNLNLDIRTYVAEDNYEDMLNADIIVSTHQSSGTAMDIPGLICVIQTVPMDSVQANIQNSGRLREITDKDVIYYYTYTRQIPNQFKYHLSRKETLGPKSKTYSHELYHKQLINK